MSKGGLLGGSRAYAMPKDILAVFLAFFAASVAGRAAGAAGDRQCPVSKHSAAGDGVTYDTAAIQSAIDKCAAQGGGVVTFEDGKTYLTGSVTVKTGVFLELPNATVLLAGDKRSDYGPTQADWYMVLLDNCTKCGVQGSGTLDGQARSWITGRGGGRLALRNFRDLSCPKPEECRPRLLGVRRSTNVRIQGIRITHPIYWALHVIGSEDVEVSGVDISGDWDLYNNDGIDIDSSSNVRVKGCRVDTADDAVCIKTTDPSRPTQDVVVSKCVLRSRSSAVKIGSESVSNISGLHFSDLQIVDSHRGLAIQLRDGGNVSDVTFENIALETHHDNELWWGQGEPVYVTAVDRDENTQVGTVQRVTFKNVTAACETGMVLVGSPHSLLSGIVLQGVRLTLASSSGLPGGAVDLRPSAAGLVRVGPLPALLVDWAEDVRLAGLEVEWKTPAREDWGGLLHAVPRHVHRLSIESSSAVDASVDAAQEAAAAAGGAALMSSTAPLVETGSGQEPLWFAVRRLARILLIWALAFFPIGALLLALAELLRCSLRLRRRVGGGERHKRSTSTLPLSAIECGAGGVAAGGATAVGAGSLSGLSNLAIGGGSHHPALLPMTPRSRRAVSSIGGMALGGGSPVRKAAAGGGGSGHLLSKGFVHGGGHARARGGGGSGGGSYAELGLLVPVSTTVSSRPGGGGSSDAGSGGGGLLGGGSSDDEEMVPLELQAFAGPTGDDDLLIQRGDR